MTDPSPKTPFNGDRTFILFMGGIFIIIILYGLGTMLAVVFSDEKLALRMIGAFGSMFAGALGFGSGYLLAVKRNGNGKENK